MTGHKLGLFVSLFLAMGTVPLSHAADDQGQVVTDEKVGEQGVVDGQQLSRQADVLMKEGREPDAARLYLAAHEKYQRRLLEYFEQAFRASFGAGPVDEDAMTKASGRVAELRNVNLSKLWIALDPDDRAFEQGLEGERSALIQRFSEFIRPESAGRLEAFLHRLYPDDMAGDRQMEALRTGKLPPSKRWSRLAGAEGQKLP